MIFALLILGFLAVAGLICLFQWHQLYHPGHQPGRTPSDLGVPHEDLQFVTEDDVALHGWWVPCAGARGTLLLLNGNGGNVHDRVETVVDLHRLGLNILAFDYRGYGRSRGWPTERGTYKDARAAYEVARSRHGDRDDPPVLLYGHSLGGAIATQLALDRPVRGLWIEGTFTSIDAMARLLYPRLPLHRVLLFHYDSIGKLPKIRMPLLIAHASADETVPYAMGRALYEAASEPKRFHSLPGLHNDIGWRGDPVYWQAIEQWAAAALAGEGED